MVHNRGRVDAVSDTTLLRFDPKTFAMTVVVADLDGGWYSGCHVNRDERGRRGVVVVSHAHLPLGAGMLENTYVSYGLGNVLWYNNLWSDTGVMHVQIIDGKVVGDEWVPGEIRDGGGQPLARTGSARTQAIDDGRNLFSCTDLAPCPGARSQTKRPPDEAAPGRSGRG